MIDDVSLATVGIRICPLSYLSARAKLGIIPNYHPSKIHLLCFCLQAVCSPDVLRQSLPCSQRLCRDRHAGVEHHVAEISALSIKELGCSVFPERRRMFVQDSLHFFIAKIVNATTPYDGTVIAAAHILLLRLHESKRFAGAARLAGHQLFLSVFSIAAQEQPAHA